jgi:parallel beta-helix repeat protein
MRHCRVSDTSTEGIYLIASNDVLLEKNIFTRNNIENIQGYYPAAVKIFNQCHRVTCRDNLVIDLPNSNGIWYDVGNVDGVFVNNWIEGVGNKDRRFRNNQPWPSDNGFFFEISKGAICAGNVFVNCDQGIFVLNSSNVQIYNNTLINSTACIGRTERVSAGDVFGWHASSGPDLDKRDGHIFVNNLLCRDENYDRPLLMVWQPLVLCKQLQKPLVKQLDYNMYIRQAASTAPLLLWSPAPNENCQQFFASPQDLQQSYPEFEAHSKYFGGYTSQLFKSSELGNYALLKSFPGTSAATQVPAEIRKVLGSTQKDIRYVGAYPALP